MYSLNLQFFAQEKTEKATPKKREESKRKGQVAKSSEVPTSIIMLLVFILLYFLGGWMKTIFLSLYQYSFVHYFHMSLSVPDVEQLMLRFSLEAVKIAAPIMLVSLVAGVLGNYIQIGVLFATDPLMMKLERIDPIKGFKRIFSVRALVELLKSIIKILLISGILGILLWIRKDDIFLLSEKSVDISLALIGSLTFQIGLAVAIILLFLSILDYMYQKYDFEKNIRMSKQDIKDEYKRTEGDPLIKSKIKEIQRKLAMSRMMQEVPKADVVITNPTHFSVALQYDAETMLAPTVIAKGVDQVAFKIKETAKAHDIVIMENKSLARALYHQVEIGEAVPEDLFKAVAEILAYVYRLKGKA